MPVKGYILINVDTLKTGEVVAKLREGKLLREVNEVLGPYDIVVEIEANGIDDVTRILREKIRPVPGIRNTLTCVTMR